MKELQFHQQFMIEDVAKEDNFLLNLGKNIQKNISKTFKALLPNISSNTPSKTPSNELVNLPA